ncbi:MAG: hypothetical protein HOC77_10940 [Chloroflexi bacterium]|nr:hypothetical protein [Chloroflexota bacterium]MBT4515594.1 hypothetical protein [Chloroflexota bacterium]
MTQDTRTSNALAGLLHAVLDHDVSLEDVARSRRVVAPSGTVVWRLPDTRELAVLWQVTDYRS